MRLLPAPNALYHMYEYNSRDLKTKIMAHSNIEYMKLFINLSSNFS